MSAGTNVGTSGIRARDVAVRLAAVDVLHGIDLDLAPGEVLGLIGPNGSGKTTLLRALYRSLRVRGEIAVDGDLLRDCTPTEVARRIGVVPQESTGEVVLTVEQMVLLGRTPHLRGWQGYRDSDWVLAEQALGSVGLADHAHRLYAELSGGEKQRALIARALVQQARYLLLDEPTNHLDIGYQHQVLGLIRTLRITSLLVLHDLNLAARYCDRLVLLESGRVRRAGTVTEVLDPELIETVYDVSVDVVDSGGVRQLVLGPPGPSTGTGERRTLSA